MDLIVRTAHGMADVSVEIRDERSTLRDLIAGVSGQAAPPAALVDGRVVDTATPLVECGILQGSVIDTDLARSTAPTGPSARLMQLTGPGAGELRSLDVGVHRIGPGRRVHAPELDAAPVEIPVFDIDVRSAAVSVVSASPGADVSLGRRPLQGPVGWGDSLLSTNGRFFALESGSASTLPARETSRSLDGTFLFNRPPAPDTVGRLGTIDAVRDARERRPGLWRHRLAGGRPCNVAVGIVPVTERVASVDLVVDRTLALLGNTMTTEAHARAILVDAVTAHGPSDLALVVATTAERLGDWDWVKWVPHARTDGRAAMVCTDPDLADLATRLPLQRSRRTLVVVTDDSLWSAPDSPLRTVVLSGAPDISVLVLTGSETSAPASCESLVEHLDGLGSARLVRLTRGRAELDLSTPLMEIRTAAEVARSLAPLRDPDLAVDKTLAATGPASLAELVGFGDGRPAHEGTAARRWGSGYGTTERPAAFPLGVTDGTPVEVDLGSNRGVVVSGSSLDEARDIVRTLALSMATTWSPDELSIVTVDHRTGDNDDDPVRKLPHHGGSFNARGAAAGRSFVARLRSHLEVATDRRLVVLVHGAADTKLASPGTLAGLTALADDVERCHLIVSTDLSLATLDATVRGPRSFEVTVDHVGGHHRGTLHDPMTGRLTSFLPFEAPATVDAGVGIRPFVFGRPPTTLERRLERRGPDSISHQSRIRAIDRLVDGLVALAVERQVAATSHLIPELLPDAVDADELFRTRAGDGIPLGLVEQPAIGTPGPLWWEPGADGSILVIGSPSSGVRSILDVLLRGAHERFSSEDLLVHAMEPSDNRRSQLLALPNVRGAWSPDRPNEVGAVLTALEETLERRMTTPPGAEDLSLLLIVREVERLEPSALNRLGRLADRGATLRINVVASVTRHRDVADVVGRFGRVVVGAPGEAGDLEALGVDDVDELVRRPGRCVILPEHRLAQIATIRASAPKTREADPQ